jgi:hypothetical protein
MTVGKRKKGPSSCSVCVNPPDGEDRFLMRIALSSSIGFHGAKRSSLHLAVILLSVISGEENEFPIQTTIRKRIEQVKENN